MAMLGKAIKVIEVHKPTEETIPTPESAPAFEVDMPVTEKQKEEAKS